MHTLNTGILIAIEGIDGSGKSTLARSLTQMLTENHYPALLTKEPGDTPLGAQIRTLVQEKKVAMCPKAEFLLFATDRAQHFHEVVVPALEQKKIVISDRLSDSSLVYQGFGRGLDISTLTMINHWAMNGITPDITIYVRVTLETAMQRIAKRNEKRTSFEQEEYAAIQKRVEGFETLYKEQNAVIIIDGNQSPDIVTYQTYQVLAPWIHKHQHLQ